MGRLSLVVGALRQKSKVLQSSSFLIQNLLATFSMLSRERLSKRQMSRTGFQGTRSMPILSMTLISPSVSSSKVLTMKALTLKPHIFWRVYMMTLQQMVKPSRVFVFQSKHRNYIYSSALAPVSFITLFFDLWGSFSFWKDCMYLNLTSVFEVFYLFFCISNIIFFQASSAAFSKRGTGQLVKEVILWNCDLLMNFCYFASGTLHLRMRSGLRSLSWKGRQGKLRLPVMMENSYFIYLFQIFCHSWGNVSVFIILCVYKCLNIEIWAK